MLLPLVLVVIGMLLVPDTPEFLLRNNRIEDARKSLARLRGKDYAGLDQELTQLQDSIRGSFENDATCGS